MLTTSYEIETPDGFDQADHRAAGLATLDAIRDAGNRWVFPEQVNDEDLEPHSVRWLLIPGLPNHPAPADIIPMFAAMSGKAMGVEHAVLFRTRPAGTPGVSSPNPCRTDSGSR